MKQWSVRLMVFGLLWMGLLFDYDGESSSFSYLLVTCAAAFACYFFLTVVKKSIVLYLCLQIVIFTVTFLESHLVWIWILLLYVTIEAVFQLPVYIYRLYIAFSLIMLILTCMVKNEWPWLLFIFAGFLLLLAVLLNRNVEERREQRDLYEQVLGEYRQLKRMNVENERVVRLEERTRIARDIHDSVGHKLTALLMQLEMLSIKKKSAEYDDLKKMAQQSLEETRLAVKTLKHEEVAGIASVLQLVRKLESENHLLVRFTTKQGVLQTKLTNQQSIVLYRSIQEALTNTMKHGSAREVAVTLGRSAIGNVEWTVTNQIAKPVSFEIGFGLTAMRERVEEIDGYLRIYQTEKEFTIEGSMPVEGNLP
jgi:signal transduction histidine kinase